MTRVTQNARRIVPTLGLLVGLPLVLCLGADRWLSQASASPAVPPPLAFVRIAGTDKPAKTVPTTAAPAAAPVAPCVLAAYATLAEEAKLLTAKFGTDTAGFEAAYATRKKEIVGKEALEAAGCSMP